MNATMRSRPYPASDARDFLSYASTLGPNWREAITQAERRQTDWRPGYSDSKLLAQPVFHRTRSGEAVLLYGSPALLVARDAASSVPDIVDYERSLRCLAQLPHTSRYRGNISAELVLIGRLKDDLARLIELNSFPSLQPVPSATTAARSANDSARVAGAPEC